MVRPTVAVFAKPNGLSVRLIESLLSGFCSVKIISEEKVRWEEALSHIPQKSLFEVLNLKKEKDRATFEYLILLNNNLSFSKTQTLEACRFAAAQAAKILVVLPFITENLEAWQEREDIRSVLLKKIPEAGAIYVGDVFGPRLFGGETNHFSRTLEKALDTGQAEDYGETVFYPLFHEQLVRYLTKAIFSFGPYGKEVALYSQEISPRDFLAVLAQGMSKELKIKKGNLERKEILGVKKEVIRASLEKNIQQTLAVSAGTKTAISKVKTRGYFVRKGAFLGIFILAVLPFLLMAVGGAGLFLSLKTPKTLPFSVFANRNSLKFFQAYSQVPLLRLVYKPLVSLARTLSLSSEIGQGAVHLLDEGRVLATSILGDKVYDVALITDKAGVELGELYNKTSLLQGEIEGLGGFPGKAVSRVISVRKIETVREKILFGKALVGELPEILGKNGPRTYLVLFQNNMELRPTGGFIGSFALASFDGGRLVEINVFDVYSADGQLKGHVEPPEAIRKYLGEANWFLRDSNWDPDFPTTAVRARWFLDKEIDKKVDGVIAFDLEVAKGILLTTGPVLLTDFNQALDYKNLYERLQAEVESDFFPGSRKKAGLMTALTREIVNRLSEIKTDKYTSLAKELFSNLEERHIQVYLNDLEAQAAISKLGYSGEVAIPTCEGNCFADWYGVVDANVGVTKANYFINRSFDLETIILGSSAKKQLTVTYENTANPALGQSGRYKTYTRVLVPENSIFEKVKIENAGAFVEAELETGNFSERKEGGVAVEISPGQTKKLVFSWETPFQKKDNGKTEYRFYVRKQAGTTEDPILIDILTNDGSYRYNTNLTRDFFARVFFD